MPVAKDKVETKLHIPKRAFAYIKRHAKRHATERGMGQFIQELVLCHERLRIPAECCP
jgi:hypothetical protein